MPLFEAARWAPSSFNVQPWRFIYVKRNTVRAEDWKRFFNLLTLIKIGPKMLLC
jgi:nitroreductase